MRLRQTWKNYAVQVLLERDLPVVTPWLRRWLVDRHVEVFVARSETEGEARRARFEALFDAAVTVYRRALAVGYPEAEAREITHILATWDFQNHGWGELVEFPPGERSAYHERYREFYGRHGMGPGDPLGDFAPPGGLPAAPRTPERTAGDYPMATAGLADDIYLVEGDWEVRLRCGDDDSTPSSDGTAGATGAASGRD